MLLDRSQTITVDPGDDNTYTLRCQITPVKPEALYEYVERLVRHPHLILLDPKDKGKLKVGYTVTYDGVDYNVIYAPQGFTSRGPAAMAAHLQVFVEDAGVRDV